MPAGGWHPDDHAEFERILAACRGNYAHCGQLAASELGLLHSQEDVARHARWVGGCGAWDDVRHALLSLSLSSCRPLAHSHQSRQQL